MVNVGVGTAIVLLWRSIVIAKSAFSPLVILVAMMLLFLNEDGDDLSSCFLVRKVGSRGGGGGEG